MILAGQPLSGLSTPQPSLFVVQPGVQLAALTVQLTVHRATRCALCTSDAQLSVQQQSSLCNFAVQPRCAQRCARQRAPTSGGIAYLPSVRGVLVYACLARRKREWFSVVLLCLSLNR